MAKEDLKYDLEQHLWIKNDGDTALIGITDYAQDQLGEILFVELPEEDSFGKEDYLMCIESGKKDQELEAPFDLEVIAVNDELEDDPERINEEPFETWICKVKITEPEQLDLLGNYDEYKEKYLKS